MSSDGRHLYRSWGPIGKITEIWKVSRMCNLELLLNSICLRIWILEVVPWCNAISVLRKEILGITSNDSIYRCDCYFRFAVFQPMQQTTPFPFARPTFGLTTPFDSYPVLPPELDTLGPEE